MSMNAANVAYASVRVGDYLHATGGLRAGRCRGGWLIGPVPDGVGGMSGLGPVPEEHVARVLHDHGARLFGADEVAELDPLLPSRTWKPRLGAPRIVHQPADTWGWVAAAAGAAGDEEYSALAQKVSASLRAAGIRLRDASDEHHRQLIAAISRRQRPNLRFSNTALADLHLAFHSLLSEMASARDYLATVAARRVGAPAKIDAANRLVDWITKKPAGCAAVADPLVTRIRDAWNEGATDPWLHDLTEYRNLFLHRRPLAVGEHSRWLRLVEHEGPHARAFLVTMQIERRSGESDLCDALTRFAELHEKVCRLADFAASLAAYAPEPATFVVTRG